MNYTSTRGGTPPLSFTAGVEMGLAPDGGLLLPERLPDLSGKLAAWEGLSYPRLCEAFFAEFATDLPRATLARLCDEAYAGFAHPELAAPLVRLDERTYVLELFHGPTLAFKDFALQLLGRLYGEQIRRTGRAINVLGATSGDTGAAAIHGLLPVPGVNLFILYPDGGVAPLQERQMACTGAPNVHALAIRGTFDDAQASIKEVFGDLAFRERFNLSAVNSINLARVLAQCVYYFAAWFQLPRAARANVEFVVPTGNFGNVLAGWMAQKMGLPVRGFKVATNQNDILCRLFNTGIYEVRSVAPSVAPSMDIQVASNFERFIWFHEGRDPARVRAIMESFKRTGRHVFENFDRDTFSASRVDDAGIARIIQDIHRRYGYVADPHTACGFADLNPERVSVVLGTAHPAKFPDTIRQAIGVEPQAEALERLKRLPIVREVIDPSPAAVRAVIEAKAR